MSTSWPDQLNWNTEGLLPAIAQDQHSGRILMLAWVNREALILAEKETRAIYWSRSKSKIWRKGEESGHIQILHGIALDCDSDTIVYEVEQLGGIACHTGRESCFYRRLKDGEWQETEPVIKEPKDIYSQE